MQHLEELDKRLKEVKTEEELTKIQQTIFNLRNILPEEDRKSDVVKNELEKIVEKCNLKCYELIEQSIDKDAEKSKRKEEILNYVSKLQTPSVGVHRLYLLKELNAKIEDALKLIDATKEVNQSILDKDLTNARQTIQKHKYLVNNLNGSLKDPAISAFADAIVLYNNTIIETIPKDHKDRKKYQQLCDEANFNIKDSPILQDYDVEKNTLQELRYLNIKNTRDDILDSMAFKLAGMLYNINYMKEGNEEPKTLLAINREQQETNTNGEENGNERSKTPTPNGSNERSKTPTPNGSNERSKTPTPTPTPNGSNERSKTPTPNGSNERSKTPTPNGSNERSKTPTPTPKWLSK